MLYVSANEKAVSLNVHRYSGGAMAAARDVAAMGRLSGYLLPLCGVSDAGTTTTTQLEAPASTATSLAAKTTDGDVIDAGGGCVGSSAMMAAMAHLVREEEEAAVIAGGGGGGGGVGDATVERVLRQNDVEAQSRSTSADASTTATNPPPPISTSETSTSPLDDPPPDSVEPGGAADLGSTVNGEGVDDPGGTYDAFLTWWGCAARVDSP
jgi:hypothetical protein